MEPEMQLAIVEMTTAAKQASEAAQAATTAAQAATTAANGAAAAANASTSVVHQIGKEVTAVRRDLAVLWKHVHGSGRPPPLGDPERAPEEVAGEPAIVEQLDELSESASETSLEVAALEGRMIRGFSDLRSAVMTELKEQSKAAGVRDQAGRLVTDGGGLWAFLRTKQGRILAATIVASFSTTLITIATLIVSASHSSPPPPAASPASPTIVIDGTMLNRPAAPAGSR